MLHGLGGNGPGHLAYLGPYLAGAGYCAFAPTYGQAAAAIPAGGTTSVTESSLQIAAYIDQVLAATGATQVDIVGHSEGGFQSLYVTKVLGYSPKVGKVIALAPPSYGTTFGGLLSVGAFLGLGLLVDLVLNQFGCPACSELIVGGSGVAALNDGLIAQPGVTYTVIASRFDLLVTPTETSFVREAGVKNAYIQDTCPFNFDGHVGMAFDPTVARMIANAALDPVHPRPVPCTLGIPA